MYLKTVCCVTVCRLERIDCMIRSLVNITDQPHLFIKCSIPINFRDYRPISLIQFFFNLDCCNTVKEYSVEQWKKGNARQSFSLQTGDVIPALLVEMSWPKQESKGCKTQARRRIYISLCSVTFCRVLVAQVQV